METGGPLQAVDPTRLQARLLIPRSRVTPEACGRWATARKTIRAVTLVDNFSDGRCEAVNPRAKKGERLSGEPCQTLTGQATEQRAYGHALGVRGVAQALNVFGA